MYSTEVTQIDLPNLLPPAGLLSWHTPLATGTLEFHVRHMAVHCPGPPLMQCDGYVEIETHTSSLVA
jgi:hypothetical protein